MEDSTLQGWTTPVMGEAPTGWRVPGPPPHQGQLGEIRPTPRANDATIKYAATHFTRRDADEFEVAGRTWTDRATGAEWRLVRGNPLLAEAPAEHADVFVVGNDELLFLVRADKPAPRPVLLGWMAGWAGR